MKKVPALFSWAPDYSNCSQDCYKFVIGGFNGDTSTPNREVGQ